MAEIRVTEVGAYVEESIVAQRVTLVGLYVEEKVNAMLVTLAGIYVEEEPISYPLLRILGSNKRAMKNMKAGGKE